MTYIFFWLSFGYSFHHIFLTLLPFDQFFDQLKIHNGNPINRLSMICLWNHHNKFITKILHLILLVNNWQNGNNSMSIFWPCLFHNPPFIGVESIRNSICYFYQCYFGIRHFCLVCLSLSYMANSKSFCQHMLVYYSLLLPNITLILLCSRSNS